MIDFGVFFNMGGFSSPSKRPRRKIQLNKKEKSGLHTFLDEVKKRRQKGRSEEIKMIKGEFFIGTSVLEKRTMKKRTTT